MTTLSLDSVNRNYLFRKWVYINMNQTILKSQLLLAFIFFAGLAMAQDYEITKFDTNIEITKEGHLNIEETIDVHFNKKRRGIIRSFENKYETNNKVFRFNIKNIDVEDHQFKVSKSKNDVSVRIGNPSKYIRGDERYVISYTVKDAILPFSDHQEFHYDIAGHNWDTSIDELTFEISLPKGLTLSPSDLKITGGLKNQNLDIAEIHQIRPQTITGRTTKKLSKRQGITTAIRFPSRYLAVANNEIEYYESATSNEAKNPRIYKPWYLALPLTVFSLFYTFWSRMRKNNWEEDNEATLPYPPEGITSAHLGGFIDQTSNFRDIVSLFPYWASEGYIEMKQIGDEIYFYRLKNLPTDFPEYERTLFDKIFEAKASTKLSEITSEHHSQISKAKSLLHKEIRNQEYFNSEYSYYFKSWRFILFPLIMFAIGMVSLIQFNLVFLGIGCFVVGFAGLILPLFKLPLTEKGAKLKSEAKAFECFLKNPDSKEIEELLNNDPSYFDKVFPFVVAFGFDESFLETVSPHMTESPIWYQSDQANHSFSTFSEGFRPEKIQSAFSTSVHDHSGSFSSGGGGFSSGSGMGGGGGSSW